MYKLTFAKLIHYLEYGVNKIWWLKFLSVLTVFFAGLLMPLSFEPFNLNFIPIISYAVLIGSCYQCDPRRAFWFACLFSFAEFSWGIFWLYGSFHLYTAVPQYAAFLIAIFFSAFLSLFLGLSFYLSKIIWRHSNRQWCLIGAPISVISAEWLRGHTFGGFPWLYIGQSQTDSPLAGYMPVIGSLTVGVLCLICSALIVLAFKQLLPKKWMVLSIFCIYLVGFALQQIKWSQNVGSEIKLSLLQGNIEQGSKWDSVVVSKAMNWYLEKTKTVLNSDIIIWPESAIADYFRNVQPYIADLRKIASTNDVDILTSVYFLSSDERNADYYNSLYSTSGERYDKRHLVPFGEYYPWSVAPKWLQEYLSFPHARVIANKSASAVMHVKNVSFGVTICYELAYTNLVFSDPTVNFLVSSSNDANFEGSLEPFQHHQIARVRAIESYRYLARASNTGVSAVIDPHGHVVSQSKLSTAEVITAKIQPLLGFTPYSKYGDIFLFLFDILAVSFAIFPKITNLMVRNR